MVLLGIMAAMILEVAGEQRYVRELTILVLVHDNPD